MVKVVVNGAVFNCVVLETKEERERGLSGVDNLRKDEGALFVFDKPRYVNFWMKGCLIPLDLITIDEYMMVNDTYTMDVDDGEKTYYSSMPILYALEINAGLIKKYNIKRGDYVFFY